MGKPRVAFRYIDPASWQGGYNYLLNLCRSLKISNSARTNPVMFYGGDRDDAGVQTFQELLGDDFVHSHDFHLSRLKRRRPLTLGRGVDAVAEHAFAEHGIDVVFENADFYGRNMKTPAMAWAPDFQHRHMPNLFPWTQRWRRELGFQAQFRSGRTVVVSSQDAAEDCQQFYPVKASQIAVVRFAIPFSERPNADRCDAIRRSYDLPESFFFLPNQFWAHKNHHLVVEALDLLRQRDHSIVVAVSGGAGHPNCVPVLKSVEQEVADRNLKHCFRILGRIPLSDVRGLMAGCRALLNPSLFEGWSTTIEEAKSFGVPMVLSDLNVHHEQVQARGSFFRRQEARDLADRLLEVISSEPLERPSSSELSSQCATRVTQFIEDFELAVDATINR